MALKIAGITVISDNRDLEISGASRLNSLAVTGTAIISGISITGQSAAPTALTGNNSLQIANTAFVQATVSGNMTGIATNISSFPLNQSVAANSAPSLLGTNISGLASALNIGGNAATVTNGVYNNGGTYNIGITGNAATVTNGVYNNGGTYNINTSGNAATSTSAGNLINSGGAIQSNALGLGYSTATQVREVSGYSGNSREDAAPRLGFHWGGVVASSISLGSNGHFYLNNNPGTAREDLYLNKVVASGGICRTSHSSGALIGSYNSVGENSGKSNPIYTIGDAYLPSDASLGNMYGIGYSHSSFFGAGAGTDWGMYVANAGDIGAIITGGAGHAWFKGHVSTGNLTIRDGGALNGSYGAWTGETNKIQWHANHMYLQNTGGGSFIFRRGDGGQVATIDNAGTLTALGDMRAPIFYDSNDTSYYLDPNGTSRLNEVNVVGTVRAGNVTAAGNQVLHGGNYNAYTPTLTGGNASGTWPINIGGTAAAAAAVPWSGITGKPDVSGLKLVASKSVVGTINSAPGNTTTPVSITLADAAPGITIFGVPTATMSFDYWTTWTGYANGTVYMTTPVRITGPSVDLNVICSAGYGPHIVTVFLWG